MIEAISPVVGLGDGTPSRRSTLTRVTGSAIFLMLTLLLVEALFESWMLVLFGQRSTGPSGAVELATPAWPKTIRNAVYVAIALLTVVHVVHEQLIPRFKTPVDLAIGLLALALIVAGLAGGSSLQLSAEGVFVYLRFAIIFYAIRAIAPSWGRSRAIIRLAGLIILLNAVVAAVLALVGPQGYAAIGFVDLTWSVAARAQGLQSHPNHLGHVVGIAMLGLLAHFATSTAIRIRWWFLFGFLALACALTQSRESLAGVLAGLVVLAILQRDHLRTLAAGLLIIVALTGIAWTIQPGNWEAFGRRLNGVISAIEVPSGSEGGVTCDPEVSDCTSTGLPKRENRILYLQQGLELWWASPFLGYGVGQFGGAVASQNDPLWFRDPRFGPNGFDMHGFHAQQVDSFWLHLLVETGVLGAVAYLTWYALLAWPSVVAARRARRVSSGMTDPPRDTIIQAAHLWALATLAFGLVVAWFSPALEDPLFAPLLMAIVGLAWVLPANPADKPGTAPLAPPAARR